MSTPTGIGYLESNKNRFHEITWLKEKITRLEPKYERRPSTIKEIRDLERQIRERGDEPEQHSWIKE